MKTIKIYPDCHPYQYDDPTKVNTDIKSPIYTGTGHLMPCCFCNTGAENSYFTEAGFFSESLAVANVESIEEILLSDVWKKFHRTILETPEQAPEVCKRKCGRYV